MSDLNSAAKALAKALDATYKAVHAYYEVATAIGRESGNPTERGFSGRQIASRIEAEVVARLSPRQSVLQLPGAPEARRQVVARPLPGLAS